MSIDDMNMVFRCQYRLVRAFSFVISNLTLTMIDYSYGDEIDDFWNENFGHGLNCLTEREAVTICRQHSLVALKTIVFKAAEEFRARGV